MESTGTTRNEISYIKLDLSFEFRGRVVFETLHKIAQNQETNNAELRNSNFYFFWGVKAGGYEYFGFPDATVLNTDIVAATDYAKYRLEINNLDFRFYVNENLHAEKQVANNRPEVRIGVFCALSDFGNSYPFHGKKKYFKVWISDRIVYHLVPCLDPTGAPCMFDLVSKTAFYNEGTGDFLYPSKEEEPATYSLRRPVTYAQLTEHGVRRLYHVPKGYNGTKEEYAAENGFKPLIETPTPEEGYWEPQWRETAEEIVLDWVETEPPAEEQIS